MCVLAAYLSVGYTAYLLLAVPVGRSGGEVAKVIGFYLVIFLNHFGAPLLAGVAAVALITVALTARHASAGHLPRTPSSRCSSGRSSRPR